MIDSPLYQQNAKITKSSSSYIDLDNIEQLTSPQYLHNYTYLEYCLFPELFALFIDLVDTIRLVQTLNSYVGTFVEFFTDGIVYENSYLFDVLFLGLGSEETIKKEQAVQGERESGYIKRSNNNSMLNRDDNKFINTLTIVENTLNQLTPLNSCQSTSTLLQKLSNQTIHLSVLQQKGQQLRRITQDINQNPLTAGLFNLISLLVRKLLSTNNLHSILHSQLPKYLLHALVYNIHARNSAELQTHRLGNYKDAILLEQSYQNQDHNQLQSNIITLVIERLNLTSLLFKIQVAMVYQLIVNGRMKLFANQTLTSASSIRQMLNNINLSERLQRCAQRLSQLCDITNQSQTISQCEVKECQFSSFNKMSLMIKACFNTKQSLSPEKIQLKTPLDKAKQLIKTSKQLSMQNVQRISRMYILLHREQKIDSIGQNQKDQREITFGEFHKVIDYGQYKMEVEVEQPYGNNEQANELNLEVQVDEGEKIYQQIQQNRYKQLLAQLQEQFLIPYYQLLAIIGEEQSITSQGDNNQINTNNQTLMSKTIIDLTKTIMDLITQLYKKNNRSIYQLVSLQGEESPSIQTLKKKLNQTQLQTALILQTISLYSERIQLTTTKNEEKNSQNCLSAENKQQLRKITHSLYVNLLTLKILTHSVTKQKPSPFESQNTQLQQLTIDKINSLFNDIFQLANSDLSSNNMNNNDDNKHQKSESSIPNISSSHPSLESVLYLFSAVHFWYEVKSIYPKQPLSPTKKPQSPPKNVNDPRSKLNQSLNSKKQTPHQSNNHNQVSHQAIHEFFSNIINKYSQKSIQISPQQIIYVNFIIEMFQTFNLINTKSKQNNQSKSKITQKLNKIVSLTEKQQNDAQSTIRFEQLINLTTPVYDYLQILIKKLIVWCLCDGGTQGHKQDKQNGKKEDKQNGKKEDKQNGNTINSKVNQQNSSENGSIFFLPFEKLISFNQNNQSINKQDLNNYLESQLLDKVSSICSNSLNEVVNVDKPGSNQHIGKQPSNMSDNQVLITVETAVKSISILKTFTKKYHLLNRVKHQLKATNSTVQCQLDNLFQNCHQKLFTFLLHATRILSQAKLHSNQLHQQFLNTIALAQYPKVTQIYCQQLQQLIDRITSQTVTLTSLLQSNIINTRLLLYKLSNYQLQYLLRQQNLTITQTNKDKLLQRIKSIGRLSDQLLSFGVLSRTYQQWILMETRLKLQYLKGSQKELSLKLPLSDGKRMFMNQSSLLTHSSSFHLLRLLALLSWMPEQIIVNFDFLQSNLQSNIQPKLIQKQQTLLSACLSFSPLPLSQAVKSQLSFTKDYSMLQFMYEYVPFAISSQGQERQLYNQMEQFVKEEQNQLYITSQKIDKVTFSKISNYLHHLNQQ